VGQARPVSDADAADAAVAVLLVVLARPVPPTVSQ